MITVLTVNHNTLDFLTLLTQMVRSFIPENSGRHTTSISGRQFSICGMPPEWRPAR